MSSETWTKPGPAIWVSDSLIARSILDSVDVTIVYARIPSSRIRSRSRVDRAEADERDARRLHGRERPCIALESAVRTRAWRRAASRARSRSATSPAYSCRCARQSRARRRRLVLPREPSERAERDRVVAAEDERQRVLLEREADEPRDRPHAALISGR